MCTKVGEYSLAEERGLAEQLIQENVQRMYEDKEYTTLRHEVFHTFFQGSCTAKAAQND